MTLDYAGINIVTLHDPNSEDGMRVVDVGNFYRNENGDIFALMSLENARKYHKLVSHPILVRKTELEAERMKKIKVQEVKE